MSDLITALGLVLVIEGALYALFPDGMKRLMALMLNQPAGSLRTAGRDQAGLGVGIVWLLRG